DVLIDFATFAAGGKVTMASQPYDAMDTADDGPEGMEHPGAPPMGAAIDLMQIRIKPSSAKPRSIPATLSTMPRMRAATAVRKFRLHTQGKKWFINGYNFHQDMNAVKVRVRRGDVESWEITNDMKS